MPEITLTNVNKHGSRELSSGDFIIQFHVDRSLAEQLLPLYLIQQDVPLNLIITDGIIQEKSDEDKKRHALYAKIQIHADTIGYSEEAMRTAFMNLVKVNSRKEMSLEQLEIVEQAFYNETIGEHE